MDELRGVKTPITDVFAKVSDRMIDGMMMHEQMADYYNFLGSDGFKRLHEHHFLCETISMRRIHRYLIDHCNQLLPVANTKHIDVIPIEWCEWEHETKELYAKSAKDLYDAGEVAAAHVICELVRDVDDECKHADRLALNLRAVDYDMQVIVPMQHELHEKYRKKPHDVGKKLS